MRYSVHKSSRLAAVGIPKATIEDAVGTALMLMRGTLGESVRIEDYDTGKTYRDDDIRELRKLLNV